MKTIIFKINSKNPEPAKIRQAASILRHGGLVAFPTDTVYGLGADATNSAAVKKIFKVKKRPRANPLPILIARKKDLTKFVKIQSLLPFAPEAHPPLVERERVGVRGDVKGQNKIIKKLTNKFWPGPLTLVLKKKKNISDIVTAGLPRVGVRVPAHPVALAIIKSLGRPIAATSANLSGKPSPTTAKNVQTDLGGKIDLILDGGKTKLGAESTVLDCAVLPPAILRSGAIARKKLEKIIGKVKTGR